MRCLVIHILLLSGVSVLVGALLLPDVALGGAGTTGAAAGASAAGGAAADVSVAAARTAERTAGAAAARSGAAACEDWVATVVSVQGRVEARRAGEVQWIAAALGDRYCLGDAVRTLERSRAAIVLPNDALVRLDQNTMISFAGAREAPASWIDLLRGAAHFFSRLTRRLRVLTPFVNGTVEGTEFWVEVTDDRTVMTVFQGRVAAENAAGRLTLVSDQAAEARAGRPPAPLLVVRPRDAVQWALYYPAIDDYRPEMFPDVPGEIWPALVRRSIDAYRAGDLAAALASLEPAPPDVRDSRFFAYRAALLLAVGRVDEAQPDLDRALALDPRHAPALALRSIIAVVQSNKAEALRLGQLAVDADPRSAAARIALSYARQAAFDLRAALASLEEAVALDPGNALAWARLAELRLAFGRLADARRAAAEAARLDPGLARTQTVLGFAHLAELDTRRAREAFERAIRLDQAASLPRLGLGLAKIRAGDLEGGRRELEVAASLDPGNALVRSYLGKAYYEERRAKPATEEFETARTLDPEDPTPWFYDALLKQSLNRPVEALRDLQRAIELNDNRAVYRSRLLLDEDLAARSASLARIYDDLGFQQLALAEGWKSVNTDPTSFSAHRFLADSYAALPRHEIARVSELLQSQLLQPLTVNPVQPQLALARPFILSGAGPSTASLNEFNPLFERNRLSFRASGVTGGDGTLADELVHSGLWGRLSYSIGQFHYETDGFRPNSDLTQDVYNAFAQVRLSPATSLQGEARLTEIDKGDLGLRFDPNNFSPDLREKDHIKSVRAGFRHDFAPNSTLIGSGLYQWANFDLKVPPGLSVREEQDGFSAEVQHLYRRDRFSLASGLGRNDSDLEIVFPELDLRTESDFRHTNGYLYANITYPRSVTFTVGASADFLRSDLVDRDQVNPKLGLIWTPFTSTTLRAAVFRTLERTLISFQTLEPTQVAGFNQFFADGAGTEAWRYGVGVDQKLARELYGGAEFSRRTLKVPGLIPGPVATVIKADWREWLGRGYLYWTPLDWLALSAEYQFERFERDPDFLTPFSERTEIRTHRVPLGLNLFGPWGVISRLKATYVDQRADVVDTTTGGVVPGEDRFWVVDGSVGYRLPRRLGLIALEARNLFDQSFRFQDTDPANPTLYPKRLLLLKVTLGY